MTNKPDTIEQALTFLRGYQTFAIFTHVTPDGDALGSAFSLCAFLAQTGRTAGVVLLEKPPWKYALPEFEEMYVLLPDFDVSAVEACVAVDCAAAKRLGDAEEVFSQRPTLSIDHHISNSFFADINVVEEAPATSQLIYDLFEASGRPVDLTAAAGIYMGIITDTGNMTYPSTTPKTFRICASLSADGLDTSAIADRIFNTRSLAATRLIGLFIRNMQLYHDDRIAVSYMPLATMRSIGADPSDTESLINYARDIITVDVAAFLREVGHQDYKVSLRSKGAVNVSAFAEQFGGGGHERAAGCMLHGDRKALIDDLVVRLAKQLP